MDRWLCQNSLSTLSDPLWHQTGMMIYHAKLDQELLGVMRTLQHSFVPWLSETPYWWILFDTLIYQISFQSLKCQKIILWELLLLLFPLYRHLEKGKSLNYRYLGMLCAKFGWKLVQGFWRRGLKKLFSM